jgi:beta-glucanase (GH16 family)
MRYLLILLAASALAVDPSVGKKLTFSDDFNGEKIDATKWTLPGNAETASIVKGGKDKVLRISLRKAEDMIQWNGLTTNGKFEQTYGYFEASMRMPAYKGHTAIFRLGAADEKLTPNIIVLFEGLGADQIMPWARKNDDSGQKDFRPEGRMTQFLKAGEAAKKFNTYGILWSEKSFTWFINGKKVHQVDKQDVAKPMRIQLAHRVSEYERTLLNLKQLPDDVDIDWVKVWK